MTPEHTAQVIGNGVNVLDRALGNAAIARVGESGDVHRWNSEVYGIYASGQILDPQLLDWIPARVDRQHKVNGPVVAQFEFVDELRRDRESALRRHILSTLRIVGV